MIVVGNWVRAVIRSVASIIVTATGFYLINQPLSPAQAGFVLTFAIATSQGEFVFPFRMYYLAPLMDHLGLYNLLEIYSSLEQAFVSAERVNYCKPHSPCKQSMALSADHVPPSRH